MPTYRKKPILVQAWKVDALIRGVSKSWDSLPICIQNAYKSGDMIFLLDAILVNTLEGQMRANIDDIIIQGVNGELYPCKPDIFDATYEPA